MCQRNHTAALITNTRTPTRSVFCKLTCYFIRSHDLLNVCNVQLVLLLFSRFRSIRLRITIDHTQYRRCFVVIAKCILWFVVKKLPFYFFFFFWMSKYEQNFELLLFSTTTHTRTGWTISDADMRIEKWKKNNRYNRKWQFANAAKKTMMEKSDYLTHYNFMIWLFCIGQRRQRLKAASIRQNDWILYFRFVFGSSISSLLPNIGIRQMLLQKQMIQTETIQFAINKLVELEWPRESGAMIWCIFRLNFVTNWDYFYWKKIGFLCEMTS